jgi:catechol 2,3-dioxygenase-like lactoylglutathione lyase family enzyme
MKLNAVGVNARNVEESVKFYTLLGFKFDEAVPGEAHIEAKQDNGIKLMIDSFESVLDILGEEPRPSNHSSFALEYDSPEELNTVVDTLKKEGYTVFKEAWDAFWGQRYAIVQDPSGYLVDLYAAL